MTRIINGCILTMTGRNHGQGFIEMGAGKIQRIGDMNGSIVPEEGDYDARGGFILPGFVAVDSAIGLRPADMNETSSLMTPELRVTDAFDPVDPSIREALRGGITSVVCSPGAANAIGGQTAAVKLGPGPARERVFRAPVSMKMCLGEPVIKAHGSRSQGAPTSSAGLMAVIRESLYGALAYRESRQKGEGALSLRQEALLAVLDGRIPVHIQTASASLAHVALQLAEEFGIKMALLRLTDADGAVDELMATGVHMCISGSALRDWLPYSNSGNISFCSGDADQSGELRFCATRAHRLGWEEETALKAITINPARLAAIDDRVGSLAVGKDGDIVVWDKSPLAYNAKPQALFIQGQRLY